MTTLRSGSATFIRAAAPSKAYGQSARLNVHAGSGSTTEEFTYLQFGLPKDLHKGATVLSAHLRLQQDGDWTPTGVRTLTKQRVGEKWLLSTLAWRNRPNLVTGTDVALTQTTVGDLAVWDWDVLADVQAWVNGASNYGWRIISDTSNTRYLRGFTARTGKPALVLTYAYPPAAPTDLHPSGGAVSVSKPVLRFSAGDIVALHVQVDPNASTTAPAFDSGWYTTTEEEYDLGASTYAGLALNATTQWRVQVRGAGNLSSPWSQWVSFPRTAKNAVTITDPTGVVLEATPPILATMTGMVQYQITVALTTAPNAILWDTGVVAGTTVEVTPRTPVFSKPGASYRVTVSAWDAVDREFTRGDPRRSEAHVDVTRQFVTTQPGVSYLVAQQPGAAPWVDLVWARTTMPDGWAIHRDDEELAVIDSANDLLVPGQTDVYTWRDWTAQPWREYDYFIGPNVNGQVSNLGPHVYYMPTISGVWLVDPDTGDDVLITGRDDPSGAYGEDAETYAGIGATKLVRIVSSLRGLEGTVTGELTNVAQYERVGADEVATLFGFKAHPAMSLRLAWADNNIPVTIGNVQPISRRVGSNQGGITRSVSFDFLQDGELPFTPEL